MEYEKREFNYMYLFIFFIYIDKWLVLKKFLFFYRWYVWIISNINMICDFFCKRILEKIINLKNFVINII